MLHLNYFNFLLLFYTRVVITVAYCFSFEQSLMACGVEIAKAGPQGFFKVRESIYKFLKILDQLNISLFIKTILKNSQVLAEDLKSFNDEVTHRVWNLYSYM